jgi:citrate lyase subunit beta/citryl-CoA lyase
MNAKVTPHAALYGQERQLASLPPCVHYAGNERFIRKALALQAERGPVFDIACDCEDGAPVGAERAHAVTMAGLIGSAENRFSRVGARVHDVHHPAWQAEVDGLLDGAGDRLAFLTLPKAGAPPTSNAFSPMSAIASRTWVSARHSGERADRNAGRGPRRLGNAALPGVVSLDFGLMDFVSAHTARSPSARWSRRASSSIRWCAARNAKSRAALAHGVAPAHNVTRALDDPAMAFADARRARDEFGFLRMWSIHPAQIAPIVDAMRPEAPAVEHAAAILTAAQDAEWGPLRIDGELHDRASYRHAWTLLQRAHAAGAALPPLAAAFFSRGPEVA